MVDYDIAEELLDEASRITPGLESPTVSPLKEPGWVAVRAMVERVRVHRVMDELFELGGRAILVTDIHACRLLTSLAQTLEALVDPGSIEPIPVPMRPAKGDYLATLERALVSVVVSTSPSKSCEPGSTAIWSSSSAASSVSSPGRWDSPRQIGSWRGTKRPLRILFR